MFFCKQAEECVEQIRRDKEKNQGFEVKAEDDNWAFGMERYTERNRHFE